MNDRVLPTTHGMPRPAPVAHEDGLDRSLLSALLAATPGTWAGLFDAQLRIVAIAGSCPSLLPEAASPVGRTLGELLPVRRVPAADGAAHAALGGRTSRFDVPAGDRVVEASFLPARTGGGHPLGLLRLDDVTASRARGLQASVASRQAALASLVAGVAHEINNPLAALFCAEVVATQEVREIEARTTTALPANRGDLERRFRYVLDSLADVRDASQRISRVVKGLSAISLKDPGMRRVRLSAVVEEVTGWFRAAVTRNARLRVHDEGAPEVFASDGQLRLLVMHLVDNAAAAIPAGKVGDIRVRIGQGESHSARLEVSDDGVGIAGADMERIFDPFFCGRGVGAGVGLGLHICRAIVESHGGSMSVQSAPGKGSTFRVDLPAFRS